MKPFLKWLGRKDALAEYILPLIPKPKGPWDDYYEPFLGSGAIAGMLAETHRFTFRLNEGNQDLYHLYQHLKTDIEDLLNEIKRYYATGSEGYYSNREEFNYLPVGDLRRSALFVYFNRFGYNGLCRYNQSGGFNTPIGKHKTIKLPEAELRAWGEWLRTAYPYRQITQGDFEPAVADAWAGDVVYCDPPYYPADTTSNFVSYGPGAWRHKSDHIRLADVAAACAKRGATVIVSNTDLPYVRELYTTRGAEILPLPPLRRNVSSGDRNKMASEILAVWRQE